MEEKEKNGNMRERKKWEKPVLAILDKSNTKVGSAPAILEGYQYEQKTGDFSVN